MLKCREFLLGLGVGLVIASLILMPSVLNKKMSKKEIENAARSMGMIYKSEVKSYDYYNKWGGDMIRGIYTALSGMLSRQIQQETLSNNISNMNTPGYKEDNAIIKSFDRVLIENKDKYVNGKNVKNPVGSMDLKAGIDTVKTNYEQGIMNSTGRKLDFAIQGNGFFTVDDGKGNETYTRDGTFKVDTQGYLVNSEGLKVIGLDAAGNKEQIKVNDPDFELNKDGTFPSANGVTKFCISNFNNTDLLTKDSLNNYRTTETPQILQNVSVKQSTLEKSNVDAVSAITNMISISRSYESNQKVLQTIDDTVSKAVNDLGSVK